MKEKILAAEAVDDLMDIESDVIEKFRNAFYNELLEDDAVKQHICKIFGISENAIQNALMINGYPPIDYDDKQ